MVLLLLIAFASISALLILYLHHVNRGMSGAPHEAQKLAPRRWTVEEVREAFERTKKAPIDVKKHLPPKLGRRYVVVGGSGLVGGWIVQHLLWRGEDPSAIRVLDIQSPQRAEITEQNIQFIQTDATDPSSVSKAFNAPWPSKVAKLPLTVFHNVAYIKPYDRKKDFLSTYIQVNVVGTKNVLSTAKKAGADCFIATSSGSIGVKPPKFFLAPWKRWPRDIFQLQVNAEPESLDAPLEKFGGCYPFSKAQAEKMVRDADSKKEGFRTGCIRPGHAIYGHGVENTSSIAWDYLNRGGNMTWLSDIVTNFVSAENVSIAHLLFEANLASRSTEKLDLGGRAYCVTDPGGPVTYGDFYLFLSTHAHPLRPAKFPKVNPGLLLAISQLVEVYALLRYRYFPSLPQITGNFLYLQPTMFNMSTVHLVYDDSLAQHELGYKPPITTLEGLSKQLIEWNERVESSAKEQGREEVKEVGEERSKTAVPVIPRGVGR